MFAVDVMTLASSPPLTDLILGLLGFCAFFFALLLATMILPGRVHQGFPQPDGAIKRYKLNGMALWVLTHMVVIASTLLLDLSLTPLITRWFWPLFIGANIFAITWSIVLYRGGRRRAPDHRPRGLIGRLADLWYGVELNPTFMGVDLKLFAYQPSLIGLHLLIVAFGYAQFEAYGGLTPQMALYQGCWWIYFYTHFRDEPGLLSMFDVIAERFGFMLVWGDLVLVPFFYCIAGWYLVDQVAPISTPALLAIAALFLAGVTVFRGANAQKHRFKLDKDTPIWGKPPELLGGRLLVSGYWGVGRKLNYSGELCVYLAIALTAGTASIVPYLVFLWLLVLLLHRSWRDDKRCRARYGELWDQYCARARFRMIPFLY